MKEVFLCFPYSFKILFQNPTLRTLAIMPIAISVFFYVLIGWFFFANLAAWVQLFIGSYLIEYLSNAILNYLVSGIMFILFIFLFNWTFVLVVTLLSAPFNSLISEKIEKIEKPNLVSPQRKSFSWVIFNEIKKVVILVFLTIFSIAIGFAPLMGIVSVALSALLVAFSFLDFSWSRHNWSWDRGVKDIFKNIFYYLFGGFLFLTLISVPIINLLVPVWATSYFTLLWLKKN